MPGPAFLFIPQHFNFMSTISKQLSGFIFNGATLALASAPWKSNVRSVYGFNAGGNGYQVFKPGNQFNSLTELKQDGVYIVDASTTGFELPGATLTATLPDVNPLTLYNFSAEYVTPGQLYVEINTDLSSSDVADTNAVMILAQGDDIVEVLQMSSPGASSSMGASNPLPHNTTYRAIMVTNTGHMLVKEFTTP
jgi:hypothetical protein